MKKASQTPAPAGQVEMVAIGSPRKFKREDYLALKIARQSFQLQEQSARGTLALAKEAVRLAQESENTARVELQRLMAKHNMPEGNYAWDDEKTSLQRMGPLVK